MIQNLRQLNEKLNADFGWPPSSFKLYTATEGRTAVHKITLQNFRTLHYAKLAPIHSKSSC